MTLSEYAKKVGLRPAKIVKFSKDRVSLQQASIWVKKVFADAKFDYPTEFLLRSVCASLEGLVAKPDLKSALVKASNEKLKERQEPKEVIKSIDRSNPPFYTVGLYKINNWHARRTPEGFVVNIKNTLYLVQGLSCFIDGIEYTWEDKNVSEVSRA